LGLTILTYFLGRTKNTKKGITAIMIMLILLPLLFFKYLEFFANIFFIFEQDWSISNNWRLPLGISFITFTIIAYIVDVRLRKVKAEENFARYALYISFFPQLIAGPIIRPKELLGQLDDIKIAKGLLKVGLLFFAFGFTKKVLFSDQLSLLIDQIYPVSAQINWVDTLFAFYAFPIQIYCDFSGYMDMALGMSIILGVRLPQNFNRPYLADTIQDFWKRWHMTLSRWLTDYLYTPLAINFRHWGYRANLIAIFTTFFVCGLWHGASWTFVLFGVFHGLCLIMEYMSRDIWKIKVSFPKWIKIIWTFHLVALSLILFRASNMHEVWHLFGGLSGSGDIQEFIQLNYFPIILAASAYAFHFIDRHSLCHSISKKLPGAVICAMAFILILISNLFSVGNPSAFIYFDF
jgi:alginate O-acetyltransferase complex protein AlgI